MKTKTSNKYVTFELGETAFGIEVLKTREIVEFGRLTPVPEAPEYVNGVINLRGSVVPVVDLNKKFFKRAVEKKETTCIVIVEVEIDDETSLMGIIVDQVQDVLEIKDDFFVPAPKYGTKLKSEYITRVASIDGIFIMILNIDRVLAHVDIKENIETLVNALPQSA